jgi:5-methylcytosine-specific restriction enzyme subunit McrC
VCLLRLDIRTFPPAARGHHPVQLGVEGAIRLEPDLSWWTGDVCVFAGDCKYKKTDDTIPNADVYQMLAYLTALQLTRGLLVYAAGEDVPHSITIPFADKRVLIRTIDIAQAPNNILTQIAKLASLIRSITPCAPSGYAPRLRARRAVEQQLIEDATACGWQREIERHTATRQRLHHLLSELGESTDP